MQMASPKQRQLVDPQVVHVVAVFNKPVPGVGV